jgi:Ca2+-binding EF-hand superfamily protein
VDINQDHILEANEVKVLLWLVEGVEPNEERVKREMSIMDKDKNGSISLGEWILYVCSIDPVTGNTYFDYELKKKFDIYDTDSSGTIEKSELKLLLMDMVVEMYGETDKAKKAEFDDIMNVMVAQIVKAMDENGDAVIGWDEFKKHFSKISKSLEKLKGFICSK